MFVYNLKWGLINMKNLEEMFNNLIKTMKEKEQVIEQQVQQVKQLESEIEEMKTTYYQNYKVTERK
jgi:uncharacterized protein YaaN involved in tellurite resistance